MTTPPLRPWDDGWEAPDDEVPEDEPWSATFETDDAAAVNETDDWPEWNCGPEYWMHKDLLDEEPGGETQE